VTSEDKVPRSYTVAHDDLADEVAARLGISVRDLRYLNPMCLDARKRILKANKVLNRSKAHS
jgi:hypothetical protein